MKLSRDFLFAMGRPFSPLYSLLMLARERLYRNGVFRQHKLPVPVVSVGNLTMGGTGKTPTVTFIAGYFKSLGYKPAVISRGYGGKAAETVNIVSDGHDLLLDVRQAGDEPFMLARHLPGIPVLTGRKRIHPCRYAIDRLQCNILILDDGFQHLAAARDIDLVLFNATTLAGNSRIFPGGELREPVSSLKRCSAFLLTGVDSGNRERATRFAQLLQDKLPGKPVFFSSVTRGPLMEISSAGRRVAADLHSPLYAFCGIAHPERFRNTLENSGVNITGFTAYPDHRPYSRKDIETLQRRAEKTGAGGLVTTEKDLVKIEQYLTDMPFFSFKTELQAEESFLTFLSANLPPSTKPSF